MKSGNNKIVFEPISAEEAKQVYAYRETFNPHSGDLDCGSGFNDPYMTCRGKSVGSKCCITLPNGQNVIGTCAVNSTSTAIDGLLCITNPTEVPDKPIN